MKNLKSLLWGPSASRSMPISIPTICHSTRDCNAVPRFPVFEFVLSVGSSTIQECWVTIVASEERYDFLVAAQYIRGGAINSALQALSPTSNWKGGLVVMRGGTVHTVVNMGGLFYRTLASRAVCK